MSAFLLKIIAVISMAFDHSGYIIFNKFSYFNYIGRLAFPIFAFQISEGYFHSKNIKKYIFRLFLFALISQIPFMLFLSTVRNTSIFSWDNFSLNVFFTLLLGLVAIMFYDNIPNKILAIVPAILLSLFADFINTDYGFYGVAIIVLFHIFRNNKLLKTLAFSLVTFIRYFENIFAISQVNNTYNITLSSNWVPSFILCLCTILPIIFILFYNGTKGKSTKYLLYFFYPVHLVVLSLIPILI